MIYLDFEYNKSQERDMGLVSVAVQWGDGVKQSIWLRGGSATGNAFTDRLRKCEGETLVCFNTLAEARCLVALGLDPLKYKWVDLWLDYRQLQNKDNKYLYGRYVSVEKSMLGQEVPKVRHSAPLSLPKKYMTEVEREQEIAKQKAILHRQNRTNEKVIASLLNASVNFLSNYTPEQACADWYEKKETRDLIIHQDQWSVEEQEQILQYGLSDIADLAEMYVNIGKHLQDASTRTATEVHQFRLWRGRWGATCAIIESNGTPISTHRLSNVEANALTITNRAKADLNYKTGLDICQWDVKGKKDKLRLDSFKDKKATVLVQYIKDKGWYDSWPRNAPTKTNPEGSLKLDKETLEKYNGDPVIWDYLDMVWVGNAMKYYTPKDDGKRRVRDCVGSDNRLRSALFPLGTQTGRNAPKATNYIYAQGKWMKFLIEIPEGKELVETDYSSQEVFVSGVLSGDEAMIEAYETDVYLAFGVWCGLIETKYHSLTWEEMKKVSECSKIRNKILKPLVLGLSYGAGWESIALSIPDLAPAQVKKLVEAYKARYNTYYNWRDKVWNYHGNYRKPPITLAHSGWYLGKDADSALSVKNMPVQGSGSTILQHTTPEIMVNIPEVQVVNVLHDAVYYLRDAGDVEATRRVEEQMLASSEFVLGRKGMKVESDVWGAGEIIVEGNAEWERFKEYIL